MFYMLELSYSTSVAGHGKYLGGPTKPALSYATIQLHAQHEEKYNVV